MKKLLWMGTIVLWSACGNGAGGGDPTDPTTYTQSVQKQAELTCGRLNRCCPKGFGKVPGYPGTDYNSCIAALTRQVPLADPALAEQIKQLFSSGKLKINLQKAETCNAYLAEQAKNSACIAGNTGESFRAFQAACAGVLEGAIAQGQPCGNGQDISTFVCAPGNFCHISFGGTTAVGKCEPLPTAGASCSEDVALCVQSGLTCEMQNKTCQVGKAIGEGCTSPIECDSVYCGNDGKCSPPPTFAESYEVCR